MKMMKKLYMLFSGIVLSFAATCYAEPAALVEDVSENVTGVQLLDFLAAGQVIELGDDGEIMLGYLNSCIHEHITGGGKIVIGENESEVSRGKVDRTSTQCDGVGLTLAANQATQSGAVAVRGLNFKTEPSITIYDDRPLFLLSKSGRVVIKRVDQKGERHKFMVEGVEGNKHNKLDLLERDVRLTFGGVYMISAGGASKVFKISDEPSEQGSVLGRLIVF